MAESSASTAWRRELSPWIDALRGKLSLSIDDVAPHRTELQDDLWLHLTVSHTTGRDAVLWIEALQLLDVVATVNRRLCWDVIVDICDARTQLRNIGCPVAFFEVMRPRYELRFEHNTALSDDLMALLLEEQRIDTPSSTEFSRLKTALVASTDASHRAPRSPISLRFYVAFRATAMCRDCRAPVHHVNATSCLTQVLKSVRRMTATPAARFDVVSVGFDMRQACVVEEAWQLLRQIACQLPLDTIQYNHAWQARGEHFFGPFLWRILAPHDNVRALLGLRRLTIDDNIMYNGLYRDEVVALCSAIASSRTLRDLSFQESHEYKFYCEKWLPWLAFALFSQTAQHQIHTARLTFGRFFRRYVAAIEQTIEQERTNTVDKLVHPVQWPPTSVRVNAQSKIHGFDLPKGNRAETVYHGKRVVECLVGSQDYGSSARVLIPGVGIGCVLRKDVVAEEPAPRRASHPIRKLVLTIHSRNVVNGQCPAYPFDAASVITLLRLIGEPLIELTLQSLGDRPIASLRVDDVLIHCPQLMRLKLVNLTLAADQLFATKHGTHLQSVTLVGCAVRDDPRRRPRTTTYVAPLVFPRLASLYMDATGSDLGDYVLVLAAQRNLHRLVVKCSDPTQRERYAMHMARHDGTLIPVLPLREKLAFLSVVPVGPSESSTAQYAVSMDVAALIYEMASTTMRRRVCTLLD